MSSEMRERGPVEDTADGQRSTSRSTCRRRTERWEASEREGGRGRSVWVLSSTFLPLPLLLELNITQRLAPIRSWTTIYRPARSREARDPQRRRKDAWKESMVPCQEASAFPPPNLLIFLPPSSFTTSSSTKQNALTHLPALSEIYK